MASLEILSSIMTEMGYVPRREDGGSPKTCRSAGCLMPELACYENAAVPLWECAHRKDRLRMF